MSTYGGLSREELEARLEAAERVCVAFGWMPATYSDTAKAVHEMWREWLAVSGKECRPRDHPVLHGSIPALAAMRDAQRANTLRRLAAEEGDQP